MAVSHKDWELPNLPMWLWANYSTYQVVTQYIQMKSRDIVYDYDMAAMFKHVHPHPGRGNDE